MFDKILNKFSKQDLSLSCYVDTATAVGAHAQRGVEGVVYGTVRT